MNGIICNDNVETVGHSLFNNFRKALYNTFNIESFKDVKCISDLNGIDNLFIVDEHFVPHVNIWKNIEFIQYINTYKINVVIFNFEKIYNSQFPWNIDHQMVVNSINNCTQIVSDIEDAEQLKKSIINKQYLSKSTNFNILPMENKHERILFLGQTQGTQYENRRQLLNKIIQSGLPIDIITSNKKLTYSEYLQKLNEYKWILNPLGTGQFINLRYYEANYLNSIVIQEVNSNILKWYPSLPDQCITFTQSTISDIITKLSEKRIKDLLFLEDYFDIINIKKHVK